MGAYCSFPLSQYNEVEKGMESSILVKSINFCDEMKNLVKSISFSIQDSKPKSNLGINMTIQVSVSFKERGESHGKMISLGKASSLDKEGKSEDKKRDQSSRLDSCNVEMIQTMPDLDPDEHIAALKLQKVYKSFRTRRKLADCAVLVEQSWWRLLDFAELKRSSISFFDIEKHETALSRWSRARTRAAKVGKGLSKNDKAQKLALQHWLEAIDPRHRYGHNLHFYYLKWLHSQSREPFFYWLDVGEGKEVNLVEKCLRSILQQQCIKYLGPMERRAYEVVIEEGKFLYRQSGDPLQTTGDPRDAKWIFVLGTAKNLYVGKKKKGFFQHSSFLAGGATLAAGRLVVENGILKAVWPHSGHYQPTKKNFEDFISFLKEKDVDLSDVKMSPVVGEENYTYKQKSSHHLRNNSFEDDFIEKRIIGLEVEETDAQELNPPKQENLDEIQSQKWKRLQSLGQNLNLLEIPSKPELLVQLEKQNQNLENVESMTDGYESPYELVLGTKLSREEHEGNDQGEKKVDEEIILRRISSLKRIKLFQLGKKLSCKWTTGAGPRIGCVRDYPSELQIQALEQVSLSPRSASCRVDLSEESTKIYRTQSSPFASGKFD